MSLKHKSETVSAKRQTAQNRPLSEFQAARPATANVHQPWAEIVSWHNQVMTFGGTKMPSTGHIRDGNAAVHQVLRSFM